MPQQPATNIHTFASQAEKSWPAEAFFISALIEKGQYHPGAYGVSDHHFGPWRAVHEFCKDHQSKAGRAPTMELVRRKFPRFPYLEHMDPIWAAEDMVNAWGSRTFRGAMGKASQLLIEEDLPQALAVMRQAMQIVTPALTRGSAMHDFSDIEAASGVQRICVDYDDGKLQQYTGGIGPGELWYFAARLGEGKTWELLRIAVSAAEAGQNVILFSTEMNASQVKERLHRIALRNTPMGAKGYDLMGIKDRRDRIKVWQSTSGRITIYDPSSGPTTAARVAAAATEDTLIIIDYVGLMRTATGARAIEDWRAAATISNELKEASLEYAVPIIAAAQINREGAKAKDGAGSQHLSQTDAFGQDADVICTLKSFSTHVRVKGLVKNRHGIQGVKWYSHFDPAMAAFEDISPEKAHTIADLDKEQESSAVE